MWNVMCRELQHLFVTFAQGLVEYQLRKSFKGNYNLMRKLSIVQPSSLQPLAAYSLIPTGSLHWLSGPSRISLLQSLINSTTYFSLVAFITIAIFPAFSYEHLINVYIPIRLWAPWGPIKSLFLLIIVSSVSTLSWTYLVQNLVLNKLE